MGIRLAQVHNGLTTATSTAVSPTATGTPYVPPSPTATATSIGTQACPPVWQAVALPTAGPLADVEASAADNIWAIGDSGVLRWDGHTWAAVPGGPPGNAIAVISPTNVWTLSGNTITHWDGIAWQPSSYPPPPYFKSWLLHDLAGHAADNLWAVGTYSYYNDYAWILHYDGTAWSMVVYTAAAPAGGTLDHLYAVAAVSGTEAWAVGDTFGQGAVYHCIGATCSFVWGPFDYGFTEVGYTTPGDVWALGAAPYHWDGTAWDVASLPGVVTALAGVAPTDRWAVNGAGLLHWDGENWATVPAPAGSVARFAAVTASDVWTVGSTPGGAGQIMHTTGAQHFQDMPLDQPFLPYINSMWCHAVVSGYNCGGPGEPCVAPDNLPYYRPSANVTRAQQAKIVSNAAGFNEPVSGQMFEDVPPGSTFYDFVQRLASRGYINGYECGSASEPCVPPGNRPYFRTNNNVTRGQISKIVSNAAGFNDPAGAQLFEDVAPGSTFYDYIQRLASRGYMAGYLCGGAGEPCIPPGSRPYFRPNNDATRGQTAKIVANTFFPGGGSAAER